MVDVGDQYVDSAVGTVAERLLTALRAAGSIREQIFAGPARLLFQVWL